MCESRPIFATLNGKFYQGGQTRTGDVPWTYPIVVAPSAGRTCAEPV